MKKIEQILNRLYEALNIKNDTEFSKKYGIKRNTISTWKARNSIPYELLEKISQNENISLDWLLSGRGEMFLEPKKQTQLQIPQANNEEMVEIPFYSDTYASAGAGAEFSENPPKMIKFSKEFLKSILELPIFHKIHIITVVGDSMIPTILSQDKLFILPFSEENYQIKEGGIYIISTPQGILVKRIYPNPFRNSVTLKSDNKSIPDIVLSGDELNSSQIIGRVIGILRNV